MKKKLTEDEEFKMQLEIANCSSASVRALGDDTNQEQIRILAMRKLREIAAQQEGDRDLAGKYARAMSEEAIPLEAMPDEPKNDTPLSEQFLQLFRTTFKLLDARTGDDTAAILVANKEVNQAVSTLRKLCIKPPHPDFKEGLNIALREFDAAALIARSDDMEMTREKALELIGQGRDIL